MRRENLPDWVHDKINWKRRDLCNNVTLTPGGDVPEQRYLGASFETYRRRCRDVVMGRSGYVPLRHFGDIPQRRCLVFHWALLETSWRRTDGTTLQCPFKTLSRGSNNTSWRRTTETYWPRSIETSLSVSFETYLRRRWDVQWLCDYSDAHIFVKGSIKDTAGGGALQIILIKN